jgi:hypothetical protein
MRDLISYIVSNVLKAIIVIELTVILAPFVIYAYDTNFSIEARNQKVRDIYNDLVSASGLGDRPELFIVEDGTINAYTNGSQIIIFRGLLNLLNNDSIALILGHELAHVSLGHTKMKVDNDLEVQKLEALADKLGAFYMIRAGYNVCKAREIYKYLRDKNGDDIITDHPNYSYRYNQFNIGCDKG